MRLPVLFPEQLQGQVFVALQLLADGVEIRQRPLAAAGCFRAGRKQGLFQLAVIPIQW